MSAENRDRDRVDIVRISVYISTDKNDEREIQIGIQIYNV